MTKAPSQSSMGFTLVELMVALVLSAVVLGSVLAVYVSQSQAARYWNGVMRAQENGRFAIDLISRTLRMQGYQEWGISPPPSNIQGVVAFEPSGCSSESEPSKCYPTDEMTVSYSGGAAITDPNGTVWNVRDCNGKSMSGATVTNNFGIVTDDADNSYLQCTTTRSDGVETLTIAEGIEAMRIRYGVLSGGNVQYRNADQADMSKVVSVEITLLANSGEPALSGSKWTCIGCSSVDPLTAFPTEDSRRRVRIEYRTTIQLRSENLGDLVTNGASGS